MDKQEPIRVLFLDIDGVLNGLYTKERINGWCFVEDILVSRIQHIVNETGAQIVISSDWRYEENRSEFGEFLKKLNEFGMGILDVTPISNLKTIDSRQKEIERWLESCEAPIESFCILDDFYDFPRYADRFVMTSYVTGITDEDTAKCIEILRRPIE